MGESPSGERGKWGLQAALPRGPQWRKGERPGQLAGGPCASAAHDSRVLLCLPRAVPSSRRPRALPLGRPCPQGSGRPCSCGALGESARRRGAAGTSPPTLPTLASPSRSLRAQGPAASESLCANTAVTASATPSASTSSRQALPIPGGRRAQGRPRGGWSTQAARPDREAWTRSRGHSQAGWSRTRSISGFREVCNSLGS